MNEAENTKSSLASKQTKNQIPSPDAPYLKTFPTTCRSDVFSSHFYMGSGSHIDRFNCRHPFGNAPMDFH